MSKDAIMKSLKGRTISDYIKDEKVPEEDKAFVMFILDKFDRETKGVNYGSVK